MTSLVSHTTVDGANANELSEWWKAQLGYVDVADDPNEPGHEECMILDPESGHRILFIEVPEPKAGKNRLHLDLRPRSGSRDGWYRRGARRRPEGIFRGGSVHFARRGGRLV